MKAEELVSEFDRIRNENNISVKTIADSCRMPYANTYNILHHRNIPRLDTFEKMLSSCGYTIRIVPCAKDSTVKYYEEAAIESRCSRDLWFRYLRKFITQDGCSLSGDQVYMLLNSEKLTMYQKVTLKQAMIQGSPTNRRVVRLNERVRTRMIDEIRKRHAND
ncbi:MAG: hypothetical protein IK152_06160 [Lachnospiraceae bacterium]|nr:hypothetical protein [Lachnospiraceae bacterium]